MPLNKGKNTAIFLSALIILSICINVYQAKNSKPSENNYNFPVCKIENKTNSNKIFSDFFLLDINPLIPLTEKNNPSIRRNTRYKLVSRGLPSLAISSERAFVWPVEGSKTIGSPFGYRGNKFHQGIDILGKTGTPIVASRSGRVTFSGEKPEYGKCIIINHSNGVKTLYAHASELDVKDGDIVEAGQIIAKVGMTGNATGSHLHFEVISLFFNSN